MSGPARTAARGRVPLAAGAAATTAPPPLAFRLARFGARVGDARLLDRLVRGRAWIAIVALALMGIVFMQVSLLRLNAGISNAVTAAETLHRQNASLRAEISKLDAGQRILDTAGALGMVEPAAGDVNYLDARRGDAQAAARGIRPPLAVKPAPSQTSSGQAVGPAASQPAASQPAGQAPAAATGQAPIAGAGTTGSAAATAPATGTTATPGTTAPATGTGTAAAAPAAPATTAPAAPAATATATAAGTAGGN